jgi:hypothetical protein
VQNRTIAKLCLLPESTPLNNAFIPRIYARSVSFIVSIGSEKGTLILLDENAHSLPTMLIKFAYISIPVEVQICTESMHQTIFPEPRIGIAIWKNRPPEAVIPNIWG